MDKTRQQLEKEANDIQSQLDEMDVDDIGYERLELKRDGLRYSACYAPEEGED